MPIKRSYIALLIILLVTLVIIIAAAGILPSRSSGFSKSDSSLDRNESIVYDDSFDFEKMQLNIGGAEENIRSWYDEEAECHNVFLPSFSGERIRIVCPDDAVVFFNGEARKNGDIVTVDAGNSIEAVVTYAGREASSRSFIFYRGTDTSAVFIQTQSGTLDQIDSSKDVKEKGSIKAFYGDGHESHLGTLESIGGRGNSSWSGSPKKSYNIKLSEKSNLFGIGAGKTWALNASYFDQTHLRNKIAFEMAKAAGIAYTPDTEHCDVYINGEYRGLYLLTEKIGVSSDRVDIADLETLAENLNSKPLSSYSTHYGYLNGNYFAYKLQNYPYDITGGYIVEFGSDIDRNEPFFESVNGNPYGVKAPGYAGIKEVEYIKTLVDELETALLDPEGINRVTGKSYTEYIDIDSFVLGYLVAEVLQNCDANFTESQVMKSFYMYKDSDEADSRFYVGPIWDFDLCLGNGADIKNVNPNWSIIEHNVIFGGKEAQIFGIYSLLYSKTEFNRRVGELYKELVEPIAKELLNDGIDKYVAQIRGSCAMDEARWGRLERKTMMHWEPTYEESIEHIKKMLEGKLDMLDSLWYGSEELCVVTVVLEHNGWGDSPLTHYFYIRSGESFGELYTVKSDLYKSAKWYYALSGETYDSDRAVTEDIVIMADWEPIF